MKPKQYYELGKFFIVAGQIVFGTRVLSHFLPGGTFDVGQFVLSAVFVLVALLAGLYFIGKGGD